MHERTGREREETGGRRRSGRRANERASTYVCIKKKGKKKKKIRYPDRSCRTLDAGPIRGQGVRISKIRETGKTKGRDRGARAANEKNATCHVAARGREAARNFFFFFFPLQKGASCGATVGRRIDQGGVDLKGKRKRKRILRTRELGILNLSGSSSFVNLYTERKGRDARHDVRSPLEILKRLDSV